MGSARSGTRSWQAGLLPVLLVVTIGFGVTGIAFFQVWKNQRQQTEAAFQSAARERIESVQQGLQHGFEAVLSVRDHLVASGRTDAGSFHGFAAPVHGRHPYLQALQWLPEVGPGNRQELEGQARQLAPGFRFFTRDAQGNDQPIPPEARFFAVYFVDPLAGNEVALGYSASQLVSRQQALNQALETGQITSSGPLRLIQESGKQVGFLAMVPVPGPEGHPLGVVQGVFRTGDLIRASLAFLEPKGVSVSLRSRSHWEADHLLHAEPSRLAASGSGVPSGLQLERTFEMAGRQWTVKVEAEAGHFPLRPGWRAWAILIGGIAFSSLLAGYLRTLLLRAEEVRSLVVARTRELEAETERHRQDAQALRASEARYRQLVEAMDEGMWILDPDGRTVFMNRRLLEMLGHTDQEVIGKPFEAILHASEQTVCRRYLAEWIAGAGIHHDLRLQRRDGSDLWAIVSGSLVEGENGESEGILAMVTDVTARRRTEELQLQSQKLESLGVLAGGIAHDFNNLLAAMLGNLGIAQMSLPPGSPVQATLGKLEKSVERAAHLTRQMLAYSGKGNFTVAPLDLNQTVQEISHLITVSVPKKVRLLYELQPELPAMTADAAQIQQVVMNLVTNACEAIGDQEGVVTLRTGLRVWAAAELGGLFPGQTLEPGSYLTLEVTDTGTGMSPEVQARIFEPFFSTKFTGRGLGLASMQGIVRGHRGGIHIDSEVGRGTRFLVGFPVSPGTEDLPRHPEEDSSWRGAGTILLAEDEQEVRESTETLLRGLGFDVVAAADGREALEQFRLDPQRFTAVLMDFTMPRMNGLEAYQAMRELDPGCRVILTSGYQEPTALAGGKASLFAAFLPKPYDRRDLIQALCAAIEA